jgi:hypothetical protein
MKRNWKKRRQFIPHPDGQQRWDRAYQYLLQWSQEMKSIQTANPDNSCRWAQEVDHENSCVRQGVHKESS